MLNELRKPKIFNIILFDFTLALIGVFITHSLLWFYPLEMPNDRTWVQYFVSLLIIFITFLGLGIIFHRIFGIRSGLSGILGFNKIPIR